MIDTTHSEATTAQTGDGWFCVHTQAKHEHIAAAALRQIHGVEVFLPRLRFRRGTRRGAVWVTEAMFPNYLFARFDPAPLLRRVRSLNGVRNLVQFGGQLALAPDDAIADLRRFTGAQDVCVVPEEPAIGDHVMITGGAFHGLRAVVTQVIPSRERVKVLLEFLGHATEFEVARANVVPEKPGAVALKR
ncbi:MAG TPA: transcription termination/antitermination NusG family protein [Verrucomicrobiae bacterium]